MNGTVAERLVAFALEQARAGVPGDVSHEAKRLLLNQLKASVGATEHEAVRILHDWSAATGGEGDAAVLWFGTRMEPGRAAMVNGALFEVLDFHDTYIPCFMHATSAVLPAVLAAAQAGGNSGEQAVQALAIGMEVEMACARLLMPTGYYRGFVPAGLVGGVGAATACSLLAELDAERMRNAIAIAMCTAFGAYESVGQHDPSLHHRSDRDVRADGGATGRARTGCARDRVRGRQGDAGVLLRRTGGQD